MLTTNPRLINFEKNQWAKKEDLEALQNKLLRALIKHAYRNVPFWHREMKKRGLTPDDIKTAADLQKLPIVDKEMMRDNPDFLARNKEKFGLHVHNTGGSTGRSFRYYLTKNSMYATGRCQLRGWRWAGYKKGDRIVTFTGGGLGRSDLTLECIGWNEEILDEYIEKINKSNIQIYRGVPSALYHFALHVKKRGIDMRKKAVFSTSEVLLPEYRRVIDEVLGECFDHYGVNDGGVNTYECDRHEGFHISVDRSILELIRDGENVSPGEEGVVVSTDLFNYAMPFIRYRLNDVAVMKEEPCSCGRTLPLLGPVKGRTTDYIVTNNAVFNGTELANHFLSAHLPMIAFQIIQKSKTDILVKVQKKEGWGEEHEVFIKNTIWKFDRDVSISFEYVDDIPKTPTGKSRYVISNVPPPF